MDTFFGGPSKAATHIGVHYSTIRRWEDDPEKMLVYSFKIQDVSEATKEDVAAAVRAQLEANGTLDAER